MAVESPNRVRPSMDGILSLLADLDDDQVAMLLDDFNHTANTTVPVARAIDLFEGFPPSATVPKRNMSPPSAAGKRVSSAPAARTMRNQETSISPSPSFSPRDAGVARDAAQPSSPQDSAQPSPDAAPKPTTTTSSTTSTNPSPRKPAYRRINRPAALPNPLDPSDLRVLLAAYLADEPPPSPSSASMSSLTTVSTLDDDDDHDYDHDYYDHDQEHHQHNGLLRGPWPDVREPRRPSSRPSTAAPRPELGLGFCGEPAGKIGGIFEVLGTNRRSLGGAWGPEKKAARFSQ